MNEYNRREYKAQMYSRSLQEAFPVSEGYHNAIEHYSSTEGKIAVRVGWVVLVLVVGAAVFNFFI
jgi:hypothetical protein